MIFSLTLYYLDLRESSGDIVVLGKAMYLLSSRWTHPSSSAMLSVCVSLFN